MRFSPFKTLNQHQSQLLSSSLQHDFRPHVASSLVSSSSLLFTSSVRSVEASCRRNLTTSFVRSTSQRKLGGCDRCKRLPIRGHNNIIHSSRSFATASTHSEDSSSSPNSNSQEIKLKQLIRPFLLTYHPDRIQNTTTIAKEVNLKAIQTLNGMIDTIDQIYDRAIISDPSSKGTTTTKRTKNNTTNTSRIELQSKYTIEFLVPNNPNEDDSTIKYFPNQKAHKRKDATSSTRRSVDLNFTSKEISIIHSIDAKTGKYSKTAAKVVKLKAMKEITKLLQVAGLKVSHSMSSDIQNFEHHIRNDASMLYRRETKDTVYDLEDIHERMIWEELELDVDDDNDMTNTNRSATHFGRSYNYAQYENENRRPKTKYEKSREEFMKRMDWKEHARLYDEAVEDMNRDLATEGMITMSYERKQRMIADIISRVRVYDPSIDGSDNTGSEMLIDDDEENKVDTLQQLIAIRRMSLLFNDNFDKLEMEDMGKMWENVFIVLIPTRSKGTGQTGAPFSRRKRLREGQESGFKFVFLDGGMLSVHVPIDFLDDELIGELQRHLEDFFDLCVGDVMAQFFPPNYKEHFSGHPRILE